MLERRVTLCSKDCKTGERKNKDRCSLPHFFDLIVVKVQLYGMRLPEVQKVSWSTKEGEGGTQTRNYLEHFAKYDVLTNKKKLKIFNKRSAFILARNRHLATQK